MLSGPSVEITSLTLADGVQEPEGLVTYNAVVEGHVESDLGGITDIDIDYDGDGELDAYTYADGTGDFSFDASHDLGFGTHTVSVRAVAIDYDTYTHYYSGWASVTFVYKNDAAPPVMVSFEQAEGGGAAVVGHVTDDGDTAGLDIDIDLDGDGVLDTYTYADENGDFAKDLGSLLEYGTHTVSARVVEFDISTGEHRYSDWMSVTFTYTAPPNEPPVLETVGFSNGRIVGNISNEEELILAAQIDFDGNGVANASAYVDSAGNFSYDPTYSLGYGTHTVWVRAMEVDSPNYKMLYGEWVPLTFTL